MGADLVGDRDWVNLDLASVKEDRLIFIVEYLTDDHFTRSWTNDQISVSGNIAGTTTTTHLRRGSVVGRSTRTPSDPSRAADMPGQRPTEDAVFGDTGNPSGIGTFA
jgi:hypothetical protein